MIQNCYTRFVTDLFSEFWQFSDGIHYGFQASLELVDPKEFFFFNQPPREKKAGYWDVELSPRGDRAVLNIDGGLYKKVDPIMKQWFGLADLKEINEDIDTLSEDDRIRHVVMNIDSPGGLARASSETAARVAEMVEKKDSVISYTDGVIGSAAYKIAAPSDKIYASADSSVGSVGTYLAMVDDSKEWEKAGRELRFFRDGPLKGLGHPGKAMTEEEADFLESEVQSLSKKFKDFVREHRSGIKESALQGQTLSGKRAITSGLIDGHYRDLASLLAEEITR